LPLVDVIVDGATIATTWEQETTGIGTPCRVLFIFFIKATIKGNKQQKKRRRTYNV
jgi:hypothetical protein